MAACPKCSNELVCGCKSCQKRHGPRENEWRRLGDDIEGCPFCGFFAHVDEWLDIEYKQTCARHGVDRLSDIKWQS